MNSLFKGRMPGQKGFKGSVRLLEVSHVSLLRSEGTRLRKLLTKHYHKKVISSIEEGCEFLYQVDKQPSIDDVMARGDAFHLLQRELCHYHLTNYANKDWYDVGVSLHQILDSYHHIFRKFFSTDPCRWCSYDLNKSWSEVVSDCVINKQACAYLGMGHSLHSLRQVVANVWGYPEVLDSNSPAKARTPIKTMSLV